MASFVEYTCAELGMLIRDYQKLKEKKPDDELLGLVELHRDELGMNFCKGYIERFVQDEDKYAIQAYMRYRSAIKKSLASI